MVARAKVMQTSLANQGLPSVNCRSKRKKMALPLTKKSCFCGIKAAALERFGQTAVGGRGEK